MRALMLVVHAQGSSLRIRCRQAVPRLSSTSSRHLAAALPRGSPNSSSTSRAPRHRDPRRGSFRLRGSPSISKLPCSSLAHTHSISSEVAAVQ